MPNLDGCDLGRIQRHDEQPNGSEKTTFLSLGRERRTTETLPLFPSDFYATDGHGRPAESPATNLEHSLNILQHALMRLLNVHDRWCVGSKLDLSREMAFCPDCSTNDGIVTWCTERTLICGAGQQVRQVEKRSKLHSYSSR